MLTTARYDRAVIGSVLLCITGGIALLIAVIPVTVPCDTPGGCGKSSFELVVQLVVAVAGCACTFVVPYFVKRRAYRSARVAFAVTVLLLAAWVVFLDAATHGWDDLVFPYVVLTILVIVAPFALIAASLRPPR